MRRMLKVLGLFAGMFLLVSQASLSYAQDKAATKGDRLQGTVERVNKDASTITIRMARASQTREVVYNSDTKIMKGHAGKYDAGSLDDVKEGSTVICIGKFDNQTRLVASTIRIRM